MASDISELPPTDPAPDRSRWIALVILCAGMLMIVLDATIVNVALPAIKDDLGFSQADLAWVVNAYLITFGGLLLLAGRLGDLIGRRRIFLTGLGVFTVASLLCGAAQSQEVLVGARLLQGVGGALTSAVILGMIVTMFPAPREQAKAIGVFSFVASSGGSIGLLAGGVLTEAINWHWIFLVNLPIGVATALLALRYVPAEPGIGFGRGADVLGAVLITAAMMLAVYTIVKVPEHGWGSPHTLVLGGIALALGTGFLVRQASAAEPLVPLRIFRSRNVSGANAIQILMVSGMFGMFFLGALYLERVLGLSALEIGLAFLPVTIAIGTLSLGFAERLIMRFGPKRALVPGIALIVAGLAYFARAPVDASYVADMLPAMVLMGIGAGLVFPALTTIAMADAAPSEAGLASGVVNTSLQVGGALGLSVLATLATTRTEDLVAGGTAPTVALTEGYQVAFVVGAALVAVALAIALFVLPGDEPGAAEVSELAPPDAGEPAEEPLAA